MKRIVWLAAVITSIGFVTLYSCSSPQPKPEAKFYYYPKTNVYFDVAKNNYVYSLDGGKTWGSIKNLSDKEPATLGKRVVMSSAVDSIWKQNAVHRKQYAGTLYNIINEDNKIASAGSEVTERRGVNKSSKASRAVTYKPYQRKPEKKRTFFQKIFGKNKK